MSQELNHNGSITVIGYSLPEFSFELCELAAKGFIVTMENTKCPNGGMGSYYSAILVPRHYYRIDLHGNHLNTGETSTEVHVNEDSNDVIDSSDTSLAQTTTMAKTAVKRTPTKKTT